MRTRYFFYNFISTALLQIITMCIGFIVPRVMLIAYGSEINGLVTSINQFLGYCNLVEAGLSGAAVYALYKPLADDDYDEINSILSASKIFYNQTGIIFTILVVILSLIYPLIVKTSAFSNMEVSILVLVLGCSGAIDFFSMSKYRVLLTAAQKVYVLSIASICYIVLNTIIIVVLSYLKVNIIVLRATALSSVLLRSFILYFYVKSYYKFVNYNVIPNNEALNKRWDALYLQILGIIHNGTPVVIATIVTSLKSVSVYSIYNMVFAGLSGILSIFTSGLSATFGDVIVKNELKTLQGAYQEFELSYYMIISWAYGCALILIMPFIKLYTYGIIDADYYIPIVGLLFTINGLLYNLKTPQGMMVISAGMYKETRVQTTIQGLIAVIASVVFAQIWGISGILIGMGLSNLYRDIDLLFFIPRNLTKLSVLSSLHRMIRVFLVVALCYFPFIFIDLNPINLYNWLIVAIVVGIYCFAITFIMNYLLDKSIFNNILLRMYNLLKTKKNK